MSRTPDHAPAPTATPEYNAEERNVLSMEQLEQWRDYLKDDLNDRRGRSGFIPTLGVSLAPDAEPPYVTEFKDNINDNLDAYLASQGVATDSPRYADIKDFFRSASIDKVPEDAWNAEAPSPTDPADIKSPRERFNEAIAERLRTSSPEPSPDEEAERAERERRINEARTAVDEARENWATVSSRRQGRVFRRNDKDQYLARKDYNDKVNQLGRLELETIISDDSVSDADKNVAVIDYLFTEQAKLRDLTTEKLKNTKVSKFIAWMNKGGIVRRVLKGGALGLAAAGAGAFLAGAAGAGVLTAGAVMGTRFVRGFALGDRDKRGMAGADESMKAEAAARMGEGDGDAFDKAGRHFNAAFESDTRKEQNKRRKAAAVGLGFVALGAAAGYGAHAAAETLSHHDLQVWHPFGGHDTHTHGGKGGHGTGADNNSGKGGAGNGDKGGTGATGDKGGAGIDTTPKLPVVHGEYPWNRMETAIDNGIIAPPKGMTAEQALHHYAQMLVKSGDTVRWQSLPSGREYLVVNGHDGTGYVWDRILNAAQKAGDIAKR